MILCVDVLSSMLGHDFGTSFGNYVVHAKEGKTVSALFGPSHAKGGRLLEVVRNFGSIEKG